jgi:hypothetical protein
LDFNDVDKNETKEPTDNASEDAPLPKIPSSKKNYFYLTISLFYITSITIVFGIQLFFKAEVTEEAGSDEDSQSILLTSERLEAIEKQQSNAFYSPNDTASTIEYYLAEQEKSAYLLGLNDQKALSKEAIGVERKAQSAIIAPEVYEAPFVTTGSDKSVAIVATTGAETSGAMVAVTTPEVEEAKSAAETTAMATDSARLWTKKHDLLYTHSWWKNGAHWQNQLWEVEQKNNPERKSQILSKLYQDRERICSPLRQMKEVEYCPLLLACIINEAQTGKVENDCRYFYK